MESEEFSCPIEEAENYAFMDPGGKGNCDRKRRFSEEQIRLLESMFENQNKLEPKKKVQLARELGLQPRQVAIWFQNKRARCKSKQLEREYNTLRADYEALLCSFESLKKEKQFLVKQLQTLAEVLDKQADQSSNDGDSDNGDGKKKEDIKPTELPREVSVQKAIVYPDDEEKKPNYYSHQEDNVLYTAEPAAVSMASAEQQRCLNGSCFPDQCYCTTCPQWWEFWPLTEETKIPNQQSMRERTHGGF